MTVEAERVCPRCGASAADHRFCRSCGLNLGAFSEIPTRAEWEGKPAASDAPAAVGTVEQGSASTAFSRPDRTAELREDPAEQSSAAPRRGQRQQAVERPTPRLADSHRSGSQSGHVLAIVGAGGLLYGIFAPRYSAAGMSDLGPTSASSTLFRIHGGAAGYLLVGVIWVLVTVLGAGVTANFTRNVVRWFRGGAAIWAYIGIPLTIYGLVSVPSIFNPALDNVSGTDCVHLDYGGFLSLAGGARYVDRNHGVRAHGVGAAGKQSVPGQRREG
jgi:hypothetical protein